MSESLTPVRLLSEPLDLLLAESGTVLLEAPITDPAFFGGAIQRRDGRIFLVMPPGRPEWEREFVARDLLARMIGVLLPGRLPTQSQRAA